MRNVNRHERFCYGRLNTIICSTDFQNKDAEMSPTGRFQVLLKEVLILMYPPTPKVTSFKKIAYGLLWCSVSCLQASLP